MSALIASDSCNIRTALRLFLERTMGMQVCRSSGTGAEAVRRAEEQKPDLVLVDLCLRDMIGLDAAARIRKAVPQGRIVIFMLYADSFGELLARAVGIDLVVSQAEGVAGLVRALQALLQERSSPTGEDSVERTVLTLKTALDEPPSETPPISPGDDAPHSRAA